MENITPQQNVDVAPQQNNAFQIIENSMRRELKDEKMVQQGMAGLAAMVKSPQNKLVNLGKTVFLVMVKNPGEVEVHTFSEESPQGLANNFVQLTQYLKNIGVKKARTYSDDARFKKIAELTGLPIEIKQSTGMIGKEMRPVYEYSMEF
jgi:hypothetical protein